MLSSIAAASRIITAQARAAVVDGAGVARCVVPAASVDPQSFVPPSGCCMWTLHDDSYQAAFVTDD